MGSLAGLIAALERVEEGSRELSDEVCLALSVVAGVLPDPTRDLHDAVDLVPEGWAWEILYDKDPSAKPAWSKWIASAFIHDAKRDPQNPQCPKGMCQTAATPTLALSIAILKALEAGDEAE